MSHLHRPLGVPEIGSCVVRCECGATTELVEAHPPEGPSETQAPGWVLMVHWPDRIATPDEASAWQAQAADVRREIGLGFEWSGRRWGLSIADQLRIAAAVRLAWLGEPATVYDEAGGVVDLAPKECLEWAAAADRYLLVTAAKERG